MKLTIRIVFLSITFLSVLFFTNCKKHIFKPIEFKGKVVKNNSSSSNFSVVLYKHKGSFLSKNGVFKEEKEIGRGTTSGDGTFSIELKWLDKRDTYYVEVLANNIKLNIYSGNSTFSSYKALDSYTEFLVY